MYIGLESGCHDVPEPIRPAGIRSITVSSAGISGLELGVGATEGDAEGDAAGFAGGIGIVCPSCCAVTV